ncbi:MAG: hypothetical protein F6J87_06280 [Spirulina sp. SIO3F2]|nr:hypothetical protein [Spirulina sp. SIO3F2]
MVSDNVSQDLGSAVFAASDTTTTINTSTIVNNAGVGIGGGIVATDELTIHQHNGDLNLNLLASGTVNISGTGAINLTGAINTNGSALTVNAASGIDLTSLALSSTAGGDITLTAGGNINTNDLISSGASSGNITLSSGGSINTFNGSNGSLDTRSVTATGDGGSVTLTAANGIAVGPINTQSGVQGGAGGAVRLESDGLVRVDGTVTSNFVSFPASISTAGFDAGGSIRIRHGGNGLIPFVVGDASLNGTSAAITTGNSFTILPTNSYRFSHSQPGIQILTNGAAGANLDTVIAGTEPINQTLTTEDLIRLIGRQAGGITTFDEDGGYTWTLPGNKALGGELADNEILQAFKKLDIFLSESYSPLSDEAAESTDDGSDNDGDDKTESVANIRETFKRIQDKRVLSPLSSMPSVNLMRSN